MRVLMSITAVLCSVHFIFAQISPCPRYSTASALFDGESVWWREDQSEQAFQGHCTFSFVEQTRVFTFLTDVPMCHFGFEVIQAPDPENCPYIPYTWNWTNLENGKHQLKVTFPESISPCFSTTNPYQFRFKVYYKIPLVEMKNPKS
jgi:hypothetical protein